jgi:SAM-dependent methyltransferase
MSVEAPHYVGNELTLFAAAANWKAYVARQLAPLIRGDVLEVGAGIGTNTHFFHNDRVTSWQCLEPDPELAAQAANAIGALPRTSMFVGTTATPGLGRYDTLLYIDVLEHIEDDRAELERAARLLSPGGRLIVLCPAHQALYSEFDRAIGHFRRYNAKTLTACGPPSLTLERDFYLDSVGMLASFANRAILKSEQPTLAQIRTWDRYLVRLSILLDPCFGRRVGKSVIAVWRRDASGGGS